MNSKIAISILFVFAQFLVGSQQGNAQTRPLVTKAQEGPAQDSVATVQTETQIRQTLESFRKINDHPLFEMSFHGGYIADPPKKVSELPASKNVRWACSIFVSYGPDDSAIYGRNFDWQHNPALLLHTNPPNAYASISMVDISYLGFELKDKKFKTIEGRKALLAAPLLPFDGMNEHGLTIGMAAVGETKIPSNPNKQNVGSLQVIRLMLDRARTVNEAIKVFTEFNIQNSGGPNSHYLIADVDGNSALIELKDDKTNIIRGNKNWQSATNFYLTDQDKPLLQCRRFAQINQVMTDNRGILTVDQTFNLLKNVSQRNTQWSVVYDMTNRFAHVTTDRNFGQRTKIRVKKTN